MSFENTLPIADIAGQNHARKLTAALRRTAWLSGWSSRASRNLNVTHVNNSFDVSYSDDVMEEIEDLEYGTQSTFPNPVIRRFMNRIDQHSQSYDEIIARHLDNLEIL